MVKDWAFLSAVPLHSTGGSAPPRLAERCQEMQCGGEGEGELATHVHAAHVGSQARYKQPTLRMNFQPLPPWEPLFLLQESLEGMILVLRAVLSVGIGDQVSWGNELSSAQSKFCRLMSLHLSVVPEVAEKS